MPSVQDTYVASIRPAVVGQRANMEPADLISRNVETVAGIGFGIVVQEGVAENSCISDLNTVPMDAFTFLGITVRERGVRPEFPDGFAQKSSALIMRKGVIWVNTPGSVTKGQDVSVTLATGAISSAAVGAGIVAIPNARWETSTTGAGGLAMLRLG